MSNKKSLRLFSGMRFLSTLMCMVLVSLCFSACALDANGIAKKITGDYAIAPTDIGERFLALETKTSIKYEINGEVFTEGYTMKYQRKNGKDVFNLLDERVASASEFNTYQINEYYYNGWRTTVKRVDGLDSTILSPTRVTDVFGGGNDLLNYLSLKVRNFLPKETFDIDTLESISAKRKGSSIVLTAKGRQEELANIQSVYFASIPSDSLKHSSYVGGKGMKQLTSISFEYLIKSDKIMRKTVVMVGKMETVENSAVKTVDATMTQLVVYSYSSSPVIHTSLENLG